MASRQTIMVSKDAKPKKKYAPKEDFASRIGVVNAINQLATFQRQDTEISTKIETGTYPVKAVGKIGSTCPCLCWLNLLV
jgi:hypothetical protein